MLNINYWVNAQKVFGKIYYEKKDKIEKDEHLDDIWNNEAFFKEEEMWFINGCYICFLIVEIIEKSAGVDSSS